MPSSRRGPWERYSKLKYSLDGLVMSGARTVEWAAASLQELIERPRPRAGCSDLPVEQAGYVAGLWDAQFTTCGWDILHQLGRFYSAELSFGLKPPDPDLASTYRVEFFWTPTVSGQRAVTPARALSVSFATDVGSGLKTALRDYLQRSLGDARWATLGKMLETSLEPHLAACWERDVVSLVPKDLGVTDQRALLEMIGAQLYDSLRVSVFYAVGLIVIGAPAADKFGRLLSRWQSGNLPLGMSTDHEAIYLCRERE